MATEIRVPTLGESVTEATIGRWFKKPGEAVKVDEPVVELETDKVTLEVPAPAAGVLGAIEANDGETVGVGALLGSIEEGSGAAAKEAPKEAPKQEAKAAEPATKPPSGVREGGRGEADQGRRQRDQAERGQGERRHAARGCRPGARQCAALPRRPASIRQGFRARARTAASPRATCWRPPKAAPRPRRPRLRARAIRASAGPAVPRALRARRRQPRRAGADDEAAPDHRAPPQGRPERRRDADDLQRGRHDRGHGAARRSTRKPSRRSTA